MPRPMREWKIQPPDGGWSFPPPSPVRCTYVEIDTFRRCVILDQHGWACVFLKDVDQAICGTRWIAPNGRLRTCILPEDHDCLCIYLALTERTVTLGEVLR